jgi:hypothetical protein
MAELSEKIVPMPSPSYSYEFHPLANELPLIEGDAFDFLVEDIREHGLREPIILFEGMILDGRNRYRACREAGRKFVVERDFKALAPGLDPEAFVSSVNQHRRHLDTRAKRAFIEVKINKYPAWSDRAVARLCNVDNKTVANVRKEMKERVEKLLAGFKELSSLQQREFLDAAGR